MYTIKEAAARSGDAPPLIRALERRYGVVRPKRTPSGYRLYDDPTIQILVAMRTLVASGWTASEAARAIAAGEVPIDTVAPAPSSAPPARMTPSGGEGLRAALVDRCVGSAEKASAAETEAILDEMLATGSFEAVVDDLLLPAAAALGDGWAAGRLSVAAEHAASAAVARRLAAMFQAAGVPRRVSVVVGLPPGSRHELGALAFAAALRRRGVGVLYLGADVTVDGWVDAMARTRAGAAVVGVVTQADQAAASDVVAALLAQEIPIIALGGAAATATEADLTPSTLILPDRVADAAAVVADAVMRRPRRSEARGATSR
jgi:DNA-binding transcriptional MerR regulator/methylmalonyl-CoA mutase cobalamin-binding subunit